MAGRLGADVVEWLRRGYVPGRSGEILLVPEPWNVVGQWGGGVRANDPRTSHASPWSHHQRVPIILYGPGFIRPGPVPERSVDVADLAPTFAELMGFEWSGPDGQPLREALAPNRGVPKAIVLVAFDGGGWNVLEQWPDAWPVERQLAVEGTTYVNATIGSAPSVTAPIHSTMGTAAYPRVHGIPENTARLPDGTIGEIYFHQADPRLWRAETMADAWDQANGNRPWIGLIGYESWHLGMMGRGARAPGGDRDAAVLWERERLEFWTNEEIYRLPDYLPGDADLDARLRELDASDGAIDGAWGPRELEGDPYYLAGTPAFVAHQGAALYEMVEREPIGQDDMTDLLFVEMKSADVAGHVWNMLGEEQNVVLQAQDAVLGELVGLLDRRVGQGQYVLAITADHGQTPIPETRGGLRVDRLRLLEDVNDYFDAEVVEAVHPSEVYLDREELVESGVTTEDVARFLSAYRYRDGLPDGIDEASIPRDLLDRRVFAAALPGPFVESLSESEIQGLGPGRYPEGDLHTSPTIEALVGSAVRR